MLTDFLVARFGGAVFQDRAAVARAAIEAGLGGMQVTECCIAEGLEQAFADLFGTTHRERRFRIRSRHLRL